MISAPLRLVLPVAFIALTLAVAAEPAANPFGKIEPQPDTHYQREFHKVFLKWCDRELVQPAKARLAGASYEAEALKYIESAVAGYYANEACELPEELRDIGPKLEKAGCTDPLVGYLAAHVAVAIYGIDRDHDWAPHFLNAAGKIMEKDEKPGMLGGLVWWGQADRKGLSSDAREKLDEKAAAMMLAALKDGKTFAGDEIEVGAGQISALSC
jgi:hypothetical protein